MSLRVIQTTDGKFIGRLLAVDPRNPPEAVELGGGVAFEPESWTETAPGLWRIKSANFTAWAEEV